MQGLEGAVMIDLKYTTMLPAKDYQGGLKHAVQNIVRQGGEQNGKYLVIRTEKVKPLIVEQGTTASAARQ